MKEKEFYKKILSIKAPIFMLGFGLYFSWYIIGVKRAGIYFLLQFIYVYLSLIIIVEGLIAFLRTNRLLNRSKSDCKKKMYFNLLILPYLPAFVSTMLYSIIRVLENGILYKREFLVTLGSTLFINFFFSAIYNIKIEIFEHIRIPEKE